MSLIAKLVKGYYCADFTYPLRRKHQKVLQSMTQKSLIDVRRVIRRIAKNQELSEILSTALYRAEHGTEVAVINRECLNKLKGTDEQILSWRRWDCLRVLLCSMGLLQMSHVCRENAIIRLKEYRGGYGLLRKFAYEIEQGNYLAANELLDLKSVCLLKWLNGNLYQHCKDICATLNGAKAVPDKFGKFISGKRIVILGPAQHDEGMRDYEKKKDAIIRFAYRGKEYLPECEREVPTDISYYNGVGEHYMESHNVNKIETDLKFICYKTQTVKKLQYGHAIQRNIHLFDPCIMFGKAFMVPNVIFDCIHYNISSIYVKNCNLYLAKTEYAKNYSIKKIDKGERTYTLAVHDYEGQFNLMKSLYIKEVFQCDEELKNILSYSLDEYIQNMEELFAECKHCSKA